MFMSFTFLNWWIVQNYTPGDPASVLYIKNLAKDVVADDFYLLFGKFSRLLPSRQCLILFFFNSNVFPSKNGI